jgi:SAM-dependent methyltransferase
MFASLIHHRRHREFDGIDIDSSERIHAYRRLLERKKSLHRVYEDYYRTFSEHIAILPEGPRLELGSGWSFLEKFIPNLIKSDITRSQFIHLQLDGLSLPFETESLAGIFLTNVLHHLPDVERFFQEADRVLKKEGCLFLLEPHYSPWTDFVWRISAHEAFSRQGPWKFQSLGPLSSANLALAWMIFERDKALFFKKFPNFHGHKRFTHTGFSYLATGGFTMKTLVPAACYPLLKVFDKILSKLSGGISDNFETFILIKSSANQNK